MALIVETGAIVAGANSYVAIADADSYHTDNGNAGWTGTTAAKTAALLKSARYLDCKYRLRWKGTRRQVVAQPLEWPRLGVDILFGDESLGGETEGYRSFSFLPANSFPQRLKAAQCELARRALTADLAADVDGSVQTEKVDVLETTYRNGSLPGQIVYQVVDQLLNDYLKPLGCSDAQRG